MLKFDKNASLSGKSQWVIALALVFTLVITFLTYQPALEGNFFTLDDAPTLSPMANHGGVDSLENLVRYAFSGDTGPGGRPLALLSFLIDDNQWPGTPSSFRYTNILLHLLTGVFIFLISRKLLGLAVENKGFVSGLSLFVMALWLLHPMNSTTVLYIVQRMTILFSLFVAMGLYSYLYLRTRINTVGERKALALLFASVGFFTLAGVLAKENAALLPLYIAVIEFAFGSKLPPLSRGVRKVQKIALGAIVFTFTVYIISKWPQFSKSYEYRDFSLLERLLVEPVILFDYLSRIILPRPFGISLFHDNAISYLENGVVVALSITSVFALLGLAIGARKSHPMLTFAILWFFVGHSVESTILPLELYFEHRNYLPMLGVIVALAYYLGNMFQATTSSHKLLANRGSVFISAMLVLLALFSSQYLAKQWRSSYIFYTNAIQTQPDSLRANLLYYFYVINKHAETEKKYAFISYVIERFPEHMTPRIYLIEAACQDPAKVTQELSALNIKIENKPHIADFSSGSAIQKLTESYVSGNCGIDDPSELHRLILLMQNSQYAQKARKLMAQLADAESDLMIHERNLAGAITALEKLYRAQPTVDSLLHQIDLLISAGLFEQARERLPLAKQADENRKTFAPSRHEEITARESHIESNLGTGYVSQ
ncbi:MAG: hypothetical protein R6X06_08875 [Gammaproteobacteria bacterium]